MAALPLDPTSDMAAIAEHHEEGIRLHREGGFTEEEWSEHQHRCGHRASLQELSVMLELT